MKYKLDIFEENNIKYDWNTVYVGLKLSLLELEEVQNYAVSIIENTETSNEIIMELAWGIEEQRLEESIRSLLENKDIQEDSKKFELEERKWRYCILKQISNKYSGKDILSKINDVFAHFGYPSDMMSFVSYMTTMDGYNPIEHTYEQNFNRLMNNFKSFLLKEKFILTKVS